MESVRPFHDNVYLVYLPVCKPHPPSTLLIASQVTTPETIARHISAPVPSAFLLLVLT